MAYGGEGGVLEPALTISEAAAACGVDRTEIERRHRAGEFPNAWRADPEPGRSAFQSLWRIPASDLRAAGLTVDDARLPVPAPSTELLELAVLRSERDEWQRRALVAEAIAHERLQALDDARRALTFLSTAIEARGGRPPAGDELDLDDQGEDETDSELSPAARLRGNWLR
jgi:hypothetical protein